MPIFKRFVERIGRIDKNDPRIGTYQQGIFQIELVIDLAIDRLPRRGRLTAQEEVLGFGGRSRWRIRAATPL